MEVQKYIVHLVVIIPLITLKIQPTARMADNMMKIEPVICICMFVYAMYFELPEMAKK